MGFYGNISNATRTQFSFDRIYPSRKAMQDAQTIDGVYVGRYVLVEYDSDVHGDYYKRVYKIDNELYWTKEKQDQSKLTINNTSKSQIVRVEPDGYPDNLSGITEFYLIDHVNGRMTFESIAGNDSNYSSNYNIDLRAFYGEGGGRGYDSTVWQKVYTEGIEKYVMVAELNTVVPTFDITADAPTMAPRLPHFDADSTNVYYKVHWQPQWGMRLKGAQSYKTPKLNDDGTNYVTGLISDEVPQIVKIDSSDETIYPSDYSTKWTRHEYNRITGEAPTYYATIDQANNLDWSTDSYSEVPAAVYFNNAGFDASKITYSTHYDIDHKTTTTYKDYNNISIEPTGRSGHKYSTHQAGVENECDIDIQELSIMLPGIGDSIAKMWNVVYGDENINHGRKRNQDISWNSVEGLRMVSTNHGYDENGNLIQSNGFTYNKNGHISTLAGCINSVHDLMGMIIQDPTTEEWSNYCNDSSSLADNLIYYYQGAYYRKKKVFDFNQVTTYEFNDIPLGQDDYQSYTYYYVDEKGDIVADLDGEWVDGRDYKERTLNTAGSYDAVEFTYVYEPNKWYTKGHNETYFLSTEEYINPDEIYYTIDRGEPIKISNDYVTDTYFRPSPNEAQEHIYEYQQGWKMENGEYVLDEYNNKIPNMVSVKDTHTITDYILERTSQATPGESYHDLTFKEINMTPNGEFIYEPGKFFYDPNPENATKEYRLSQDLHPIEGRQYLYGEVGDSSTKEYTTWDDVSQTYITITEEIYEFVTPPYPVEVVDIANYKEPKQEIGADGSPIFNPDGSPKYILEGDKPKLFNIHIYIPEPVALTEEEITAGITEPPANLFNWKQITHKPFGYNGPYYCIDTNVQFDSFYSYGQFWYVEKSEMGEEDDGTKKPLTYRIDNTPSSNSDRFYYKIIATEISADSGKELVYKPSQYYYKNEAGDYAIDYSLGPVKDREYYKSALYYVLKDHYNLFGKGSIWNPAVSTIPNSIELATRQTKYTMQPLHGFARTLNTIHGLILKVNDLLEVNDFDTRDLATVQGCVNNLKDIIAKFGELAPEEFVIVDKYGRVAGADFSTLQSTSYDEEKILLTPTGTAEEIAQINIANEKALLKDIDGDKFSEVDSLENMRQQWITANINGNVNNPFVTIHHNFQKVTDTISESNINLDAARTQALKDGQGNILDGHSIQLYTPIVDAMGHVVGKNIETVTLPYGFKTIVTNGRNNENESENATSSPNTKEVVAENTQDTLRIDSGNKWIRIDSDENADKLTIYHDIHAIPDSNPNPYSYNHTLSNENSETVTFTVPVYTLDKAGHFTTNGQKVITMPFSYGIITGDSGTSTSSATFDTLKIASGDEWLETIATTDTLTINHTGPVVGTATTKNNVTPKFGETFTLEDWHFDNKGHKFDLTTHTVTIPTLAIENATSGNVLIDVEMSGDNQKIKEIKSNVGNLKLADYVIGTNANIVAAEDTINQAFGKLQVQMNNEVTNREQAISQEVENRNTAISNAISTEVTNRNTAITNAINTEVANRDAAIANAISTEVINRNTAISDAFNNTTFDYGDITLDPTVQQQTIAWLFKKVAELEAQVIALTNPTV